MSRALAVMQWSRAPIVLVAWTAIAADAGAIDGIRPRTPILWPDDVPCLVEVDRSIEATVVLPYAIPFEDPAAGQSITDDEVDDGRRHQLLAFSQDIDPRVAMPEWIGWSDVMRAEAAGLADAATIDDSRVLEGHPLLGDTFVRIDADDARRPITFAAAEAGAAWDTSALVPGTYVVRGYTWDPWPNLWALPRHGVVRVFDDVDDPTLVPALAVGMDALVLHRNEVGMIEGCLAAPAGTTLSAAWADFTDADGELTELVSGVVAEGGVVAIPFEPPEALWGGFAVVRVTATAPNGLRWDAFVPESITILASDAPMGCADDTGDSGCAGSSSGDDGAPSESSGVASTTGETGGDPIATTTGGESSGGGPAQAPDTGSGAEGCGCATAPPRAAAALLLLALARRRRRSSAQR